MGCCHSKKTHTIQPGPEAELDDAETWPQYLPGPGIQFDSYLAGTQALCIELQQQYDNYHTLMWTRFQSSLLRSIHSISEVPADVHIKQLKTLLFHYRETVIKPAIQAANDIIHAHQEKTVNLITMSLQRGEAYRKALNLLLRLLYQLRIDWMQFARGASDFHPVKNAIDKAGSLLSGIQYFPKVTPISPDPKWHRTLCRLELHIDPSPRKSLRSSWGSHPSVSPSLSPRTPPSSSHEKSVSHASIPARTAWTTDVITPA